MSRGTITAAEVGASGLRVEDTIEVWWTPGRDTITALRPYNGPLECLKGGYLADFALSKTGMTIEPGSSYVVLNRAVRPSIRDICDPAWTPAAPQRPHPPRAFSKNHSVTKPRPYPSSSQSSVRLSPRHSSSGGEVVMTKELTFRSVLSYRGCHTYEVCGDGSPYRVEVRHDASAYHRSIFGGDDAKWQRDVVAAIGLLHRRHDCDTPVSQRVVDAFNAWRAAEHAQIVEEIRSQPGRHGNLAPDNPILVPPQVVCGARYEAGKGWVVNANSGTGHEADASVDASALDETRMSP